MLVPETGIGRADCKEERRDPLVSYSRLKLIIHVEAVKPRHSGVEEQEVWFLPVDHSQSLDTVPRLEDRMTSPLEQHGHVRSDMALTIGYQYPCHLAPSVSLSRNGKPRSPAGGCIPAYTCTAVPLALTISMPLPWPIWMDS